jgi:hypothetical protein
VTYAGAQEVVVVESVNGGRSEGSAGRGDLNNKCGEHSTQRLGRAEEEARYYYYSPGVAARPPLYTARLRLTRPRPRTHVRTFALPTSTTTHTAKPPLVVLPNGVASDGHLVAPVSAIPMLGGRAT